MFKMLNISHGIFELFREEVEKRSCLISFRKLVHIKIFRIRRNINIMPNFADFFRFFRTIPLLIL